MRIADATTDADGAFLALTPWTRGGLARATAQGVSSLPVSVGRRPGARRAADVTSLPAGGVVTLKGRMRPPGTVKVVVQRRSRGRWNRTAVVTRKARDAFTVPVRLRRDRALPPDRQRRLDGAGRTAPSRSPCGSAAAIGGAPAA